MLWLLNWFAIYLYLYLYIMYTCKCVRMHFMCWILPRPKWIRLWPFWFILWHFLRTQFARKISFISFSMRHSLKSGQHIKAIHSLTLPSVFYIHIYIYILSIRFYYLTIYLYLHLSLSASFPLTNGAFSLHFTCNSTELFWSNEHISPRCTYPILSHTVKIIRSTAVQIFLRF